MTKITIDRAAVEQALESIDWLRHHLIQHHGCLHMDPIASGIPTWLNKNEATLRAALAKPQSTHSADCYQWHHKCAIAEVERLRAAPPQRKPLTEVELEMAYRDIWRDLPTDFDHTSSGWIEQGIKYAERAHGIGETK